MALNYAFLYPFFYDVDMVEAPTITDIAMNLVVVGMVDEMLDVVETTDIEDTSVIGIVGVDMVEMKEIGDTMIFREETTTDPVELD